MQTRKQKCKKNLFLYKLGAQFAKIILKEFIWPHYHRFSSNSQCTWKHNPNFIGCCYILEQLYLISMFSQRWACLKRSHSNHKSNESIGLILGINSYISYVDVWRNIPTVLSLRGNFLSRREDSECWQFGSEVGWKAPPSFQMVCKLKAKKTIDNIKSFEIVFANIADAHSVTNIEQKLYFW